MSSISSSDILGRLHALHDHLPAGVVVHAADGRIVFVNRLAQELLGRKEADLLGIDPREGSWIVLREDGSIRPPEEFPATVVLDTGKKLSGHLAASSMRVKRAGCCVTLIRNATQQGVFSTWSSVLPIARN